MSPVEALRVIFRHWLIITFGVALSVAATAAGYVTIPNSYSSSSVVMVLQRSTKATASGENPYLTMDASLTVTAAAVQRAVSDSPVMAASLAAIDASGTFLVTPVMTGPFLQIDTGATTPADTLAIQQLVRDQMKLMLTTLQSSVGAPSNLQIQLNEVTQPTKPVAVLKRKLQFVGAILFGGLALTVSLAFLADRIRSRRKGGDPAEQLSDPGDPTVPEPVETTTQARAQAPTATPAPARTRAPAADAGTDGGSRGDRVELNPLLILRPNVSPRAPEESRDPDPARAHVSGRPTAPQQRLGSDRLVGREELAFVPSHDNRTRNGVNGYPAAPASPESGWSCTDPGPWAERERN